MPVINDEEGGQDRVVLNPLLTIEEAVIVLLGKSLKDYPFVYYNDLGEHEDTYALEDYLQLFYDNDDKDLAKEGMKHHETLLDAIESRELFLFNNQIRIVKLIEWADQKGIYINTESLMYEVNGRAAKRVKGNLYGLRKAEILKVLSQLGHDNPQQLPIRQKGQPGVKAQVKKIVMKKDQLFHSLRVFDDTWQDMRDEDLISESNN